MPELQDIYNHLIEEAKLNAEFRGMAETKLESIEQEAKRTNGRVTLLEKWHFYTAGGLGLLVFLLSFFKDTILSLFS